MGAGRARHAGARHAVSLLLLLLSGCAGALEAPYAGLGAAYEPGLPSLDLLAVATAEDGRTGIEIAARIEPATLIFARADSSYLARFDLALRLLDEQGREVTAARLFADTLEAATAEAAAALGPILRREHVPLGPGRYVAEATLEDEESGRRAVRRQRVEVPGEGPALGAIALEAGGEPVVSLHLPSALGALRARAALFGAPPGASALAELFRLEADTAVAYPPFWVPPLRGSLRYRGVSLDLARADTLLARALPPPAGPAQEFALELPDLPRGVYLVRLRLRDAGGEALAEAERAFAVLGPEHPHLATLDELIEALAYIAYPRELAFIREGATAPERRRRFDAFWGSLVAERRVAENLLARYFERVEEANLRFTSHQPGWKTDRGMIYVVFGEPEYVEQTFEAEVWHYGYGARDAAGAFAFERVAGASPFAQVVLQRRPAYERPWLEAIRRWRSGQML